MPEPSGVMTEADECCCGESKQAKKQVPLSSSASNTLNSPASVICDVLQTLPHLPWVIAGEVGRYSPLIVCLGFIKFLCHLEQHCIELTWPDGSVVDREEFADLAGHPGILAWENPDVYVHSHSQEALHLSEPMWWKA